MQNVPVRRHSDEESWEAQGREEQLPLQQPPAITPSEEMVLVEITQSEKIIFVKITQLAKVTAYLGLLAGSTCNIGQRPGCLKLQTANR